MTIIADGNGNVAGKFTIPAGVTAGTKDVKIVGSGGSTASAVFVGEGLLISEVKQSQSTVVQTYYDPLAQTFSLDADYQIGGVSLYVQAKGTTEFTVQLRETSNGYPTQKILAVVKKPVSALTVGAWNTFEFATPYLVSANTEYAIVVMCNDAVGAVGVAQLGQWDTVNARWVTQQPYQVGVLLSSSNASTWTAHQDKDLAFKLLARKYDKAVKTVPLGVVAVTDATDLVVNAMVDAPATGANASLLLTLPDGTNISAGDGQMVHLTSAVTGNISVNAVLSSTDYMSGLVYPGSQLVVGQIAASGDYVTNAISAGSSPCNVRVIFDAQLPSGSAVTVSYKGTGVSDEWVTMSQDPLHLPTAQGDGIYEYNYYAESVALSAMAIKLSLIGSPSARPYLYNLRVSLT